MPWLKSKEVATDGDLVDIAFEALVAIETCPCGCGTKYDCHDIHLQLVKQVVGDNEAEQQKLRVALYQKDATTVKKVLTTGLDPNFVYDSGDDMGKTPAMIAASYGSQDILHSLLCAGAEWLEEHFETGRTVLHLAAEANIIEAVQFVLENCNVDIDFVTHFGLEERSAGMLTTCREIRDMILDLHQGVVFGYCSRVGQWLRESWARKVHAAAPLCGITVELEIRKDNPQKKGCPHEICVKRDFRVWWCTQVCFTIHAVVPSSMRSGIAVTMTLVHTWLL